MLGCWVIRDGFSAFTNSLATLVAPLGPEKGNYGVTLSGLRPGVAGALEQFVGLSMQTYEGQGNFTQTDNTHGPSGAATDQPGWGTYTVNPDCSGTKTLWLEGLPSPIENRIVILDRGDDPHCRDVAAADRRCGPRTESLLRRAPFVDANGPGQPAHDHVGRRPRPRADEPLETNRLEGRCDGVLDDGRAVLLGEGQQAQDAVPGQES